ncbi:MAG: dihydroorotase family protein [Alphaproteobacteria bacterium]|nr:dihydroorotase family protein [Alphaproteobacteria bacterium]
MYDLLIEDATIVSASGRQVADIAIEDGVIAYVGSRPAGRSKEKLSAIGKFVMPGVIDTSVYLSWAPSDLPDHWTQETRAAVAGGVTTVIELGDRGTPTTTPARLNARRKVARKASRANFGFWGMASQAGADTAQRLLEAGAVALQVDMGAFNGPLALDDGLLEDLFVRTTGVLGVQAADPSLLKAAAQTASNHEKPADTDVFPGEAGAAAVLRLVDLVKAHQRQIHLIQISTAAELHPLDPIRGDLPISVETSPHHLFLSCETSAELLPVLKNRPPIRPELDRRSLWTATRRRRIDSIASGHTGVIRDDKLRPYWEATPGLPGTELMLSLIRTAVHHGRLGLERMVELLSESPARLLGVVGKGRIEKGYDADLVLFSEGRLAPLSERTLLSRARWTPYGNKELAPPPELVFVGGRVAARNGAIADDDVRGREIRTRR